MNRIIIICNCRFYALLDVFFVNKIENCSCKLFFFQAQDVDIQYENDNVYHKMSPGNAYKGVTRWFSPSNSYIQIDSFEQPVACGKDFQLDILYSTPNDTNYNFYVMVSFQISNLLFISLDTNRSIGNNVDHFCLHFHRYKYRNCTYMFFICSLL